MKTNKNAARQGNFFVYLHSGWPFFYLCKRVTGGGRSFEYRIELYDKSMLYKYAAIGEELAIQWGFEVDESGDSGGTNHALYVKDAPFREDEEFTQLRWICG